MKLSDLKKGYAEAKATATGSRELLDTIVTDVVSSGRTDDGFAYVQTKDPVKILVDGEYRLTNRIVMFKEDEDAFKGAFHLNADPIMLNGLQSPKARIIIEGYENADGDAAITHSVSIQLNSKDEQALKAKAREAGLSTPVNTAKTNPFE